MKFLRTFENFYLPSDMETDEQDYLMRNRKMQNVVKPDDDDEYCEPCEDDNEMGAELPSFSEEDNMRMNRNEFEEDHRWFYQVRMQDEPFSGRAQRDINKGFLCHASYYGNVLPVKDI